MKSAHSIDPKSVGTASFRMINALQDSPVNESEKLLAIASLFRMTLDRCSKKHHVPLRETASQLLELASRIMEADTQTTLFKASSMYINNDLNGLSAE